MKLWISVCVCCVKFEILTISLAYLYLLSSINECLCFSAVKSFFFFFILLFKCYKFCVFRERKRGKSKKSGSSGKARKFPCASRGRTLLLMHWFKFRKCSVSQSGHQLSRHSGRSLITSWVACFSDLLPLFLLLMRLGLVFVFVFYICVTFLHFSLLIILTSLMLMIHYFLVDDTLFLIFKFLLSC